MSQSFAPLIAALLVAVAGATGVQLSMIASDGYYVIVTGPLFLAICGITLLVTIAYTLRFLTRGFARWLWAFAASIVALFITAYAGLALGSFINHAILKWPTSDHRLP